MARTDDDTWGPDSGVGMTATFGAVARALATSRGLINDPLAEQLVRAAGVQYFARMLDDQRYADDGGDNAIISGLITLLGVHTRFLDEFLAAAGRGGIRQVVILASGLDTRPYRMWWPSGTTVYEIDQPDVIDFKTAVLRRLGAELTANRRAVGVDLRRDWLTALQRVGFDAAEPTVWIAETLLIGFLPPDEQNRLLHDVSAASAPGSRFAGDHLPTRSPFQLEAAQSFVDTWRQFGLDVDLAGLTYPGEYRAVPRSLADHGWQAVERNVADLFTAIGMGTRWRGTPDDNAITPRYVTATRSAGPGARRGRNASA
ncbi:SAM-dependent methyltransferase [Mycobacterium montefiorense]|uniref:S-adenosyl-L-methionine-dependent methyltransferase n=2 Tax=Mycobacterium montefiorense TaxID=154654 RepID=A0AA37UXM2_9MYCO|nr:SAM-dependent methyltransferase [Mycobacterium montefiorense]GBG40451.1 putative S-adenosyl-L-methionine-dependent methyltransferase [Mycobacterium montefiorense]GKU36450.1 putative S-adenosyl-L-methionine-dependent methyltransferase [Mycobacterium montefiorense]GKU39378.1 putative S-adenosyl-L-methionine-dependent methyltransferase [Mycobacterium montefiorense]GKU44631.1 putative S-adenosyl-L-methionine-dependent methyltransferase [Mycobacterium montefiorense]GKU54017.1 putative S-adenosyl